jgi:hypothetical protein
MIRELASQIGSRSIALPRLQAVHHSDEHRRIYGRIRGCPSMQCIHRGRHVERMGCVIRDGYNQEFMSRIVVEHDLMTTQLQTTGWAEAFIEQLIGARPLLI